MLFAKFLWHEEMLFAKAVPLRVPLARPFLSEFLWEEQLALDAGLVELTPGVA